MDLAASRTYIRDDGRAIVELLARRLPWRGLVLVASVALAYNYSLQTLVRGLDLQTPLAYLALVPLIALLLGALSFRLQPVLRPIHDRQLDWIMGLFFVGIAASIDLLLPSAYSADFWLHRVDMLGLPFFAAGVVSLLYGLRRLWAMRWAIVFLLLAWPDPWVSYLAAAVGASTDVTLQAVTLTLRLIPLAQPLGQGSFLISHGGEQFSLAVGSACSGINSLVGFAIVGTAFNTILSGGFVRRMLWFAAGLAVAGALNVARIDLIFLAGGLAGEGFAIDVLHPMAGIVVFGVGTTIMLALAPRFGLEMPRLSRSDGPASRPRKARPQPANPPKRLRPAIPMLVSLALGVALAVPNAAFAQYDSLVDAFGHPVLGTIDPNAVAVNGWAAAPSSSFDQATTYFGSHATWERVPFSATGQLSPLAATVYLDIIRTDDAGSLASYGVEACYNFHGFAQVQLSSIDVGAGVEAKVASYRSPIAATDWSILWWEWPYDAGGQTRYERLVLLAPLDSVDQPGGRTSIQSFAQAETTLASFARSIVTAAMNDPAPADPGTQP